MKGCCRFNRRPLTWKSQASLYNYLFPRFFSSVLPSVSKADRIYILPGKEYGWKPMPFFLALHVPVRAAEKIKQHLVAQVGTTNPDGYDSVHLFRLFGKSFDPLFFVIADQQIFFV